MSHLRVHEDGGAGRSSSEHAGHGLGLGLGGLGSAGAAGSADALGPGVEQPSAGELVATAPAVPTASGSSMLVELAFMIGLAILAGYLFRGHDDDGGGNDSEQSKEE